MTKAMRPEHRAEMLARSAPDHPLDPPDAQLFAMAIDPEPIVLMPLKQFPTLDGHVVINPGE